MKVIITFGCVFLLSGCSLFTQGPNEAKARSLEEGRAAIDRDVAIGNRARQYEKTGLSQKLQLRLNMQSPALAEDERSD